MKADHALTASSLGGAKDTPVLGSHASTSAHSELKWSRFDSLQRSPMGGPSCSTPLSQISTAPCTPNVAFLDDLSFDDKSFCHMSSFTLDSNDGEHDVYTVPEEEDAPQEEPCLSTPSKGAGLADVLTSMLQEHPPFAGIFQDAPETQTLPSALKQLPRSAVEEPGQLPDDAWQNILSLVAEVKTIGCLTLIDRRFSTLLKSELVWTQRHVQLSGVCLARLAPQLDTWLGAWRLASKLIVPKSAKLISKVTQQNPNLHVEVAWRFDHELKGAGVEVINRGRSVKRVAGSEEELVVLGDAPLSQTIGGHDGTLPYLEVLLDSRSCENAGDGLNDFGIGVTTRQPSKAQVGAVADEVPFSWVVDFTKHSAMLSVNNLESAKGWQVSGEDLKEGDRVGLRFTAKGSIEIYINGKLRDHLIPGESELVPQAAELFPVFDLYGCTEQLSRTYADSPFEEIAP